jgi:hypothetical protein
MTSSTEQHCDTVKLYLSERESSLDITKLTTFFTSTGSIIDSAGVMHTGTDELTKYFLENQPPVIVIAPSITEPVQKADGSVSVTLTFLMVKTFDVTFTFEEDSNLFVNVTIKKTSWM